MDSLAASLPPAMTARSEGGISMDAYTQMQCDWYNATEGKLTGYDCPKCKNRGSIAAVKDGYQYPHGMRLHEDPAESCEYRTVRIVRCTVQHDI